MRFFIIIIICNIATLNALTRTNVSTKMLYSNAYEYTHIHTYIDRCIGNSYRFTSFSFSLRYCWSLPSCYFTTCIYILRIYVIFAFVCANGKNNTDKKKTEAIRSNSTAQRIDSRSKAIFRVIGGWLKICWLHTKPTYFYTVAIEI